MKVFGMIRRAKRFSHPDKLVKILRGMRRIIVIFTLLLTPAVMWAQAAGGHVIRQSSNKTTSNAIVDNAPRGKVSQAIDLGLPSGT